MPGWKPPGFPRRIFHPPRVGCQCGNVPLQREPCNAAKIRPWWFKGTYLTEHVLGPCTTVYDFGRNFAGRVQIRAKGTPGQTLRISFSELLIPDGDLQPVIDCKEQYYHEYTFGSDHEKCWHARFTYYGFRYVKVVSEGRLIDLAGEEMFSDMPSGGTFRCSNNLWNRTHDIILRAIESNAKSVFTDCPHREKLG